MQKNLVAAAAALALLGGLAPLAAHAEGHYVPGVEGIQAASAPPPGLYYLGYLVNYNVNSFRAPGSSTDLPGHNSATVTALANRFVWMTGHKVLGADYGVETIVPLLRTSLTIHAAGISDSRSGVGDIYVGPVVLGWHGPQWDAVAAAGVWLESGSTSHAASAGKGFKSTMLTGGLTYYFDEAKTISGAALMRFERHGRDDSGFRHGNQATVEWGVAKAFGPVQAGVVGYSQWQTSNDSGMGASLNKSSRHALGGEVVYPVAPGTALKGAIYKELRAEAGTGPQPKGSLLRLTLVKAF
ncbi:MAG: transporter [Burkholderiaceae bacterium]|nr:transporter [Burkholderiaceae bacterium]